MHGSLVLVVFYSPIYIYIYIFLPSVLLPERQASSGE